VDTHHAKNSEIMAVSVCSYCSFTMGVMFKPYDGYLKEYSKIFRWVSWYYSILRTLKNL